MNKNCKLTENRRTEGSGRNLQAMCDAVFQRKTAHLGNGAWESRVNRGHFSPITSLVFFLLIFLCVPVFAQQRQAARPYWYTFEQGKTFFRNGDYGKALLAFEDAKRNRKAMYDKMEQDLVTVMSLRDVRKMYDSLDELEKYIAANYMESANAALKELYFRKGRESLYGSQKNALAAIKTLKDYPEAEYWIGETYRVEGELNIALKQYKRAYDQRVNLENPSFDIEILYKIVDVLKIQQNYIEMEAQAERLVALDTLWGGESGFYARTAMERILENDGMERFLTVYRYDNPQVERIHRVLGFFYYASGRHVSALDHLIFSFLIQNTIIINDLIRNRYDFEVTTMDALIREAGQNPTLAAYMQDVEYYKTIYYLGATFYATGRAKAARSCWTLLSRCNAGEWTVKAEGQLRRPSIERAIETP